MNIGPAKSYPQMDNLTVLFIVVLVAVLVADAVLTYRSHRQTMKRMEEVAAAMKREIDER